MMKLDWNSNLLWENDQKFHHDAAFTATGEIYALIKGKRFVSLGTQEVPIEDDSIVYLTSEGEVKDRLSIYDLLTANDVPVFDLPQLARRFLKLEQTDSELYQEVTERGFDVFHTNTIAEIDRNIGIARKGDLLICVRTLNLIAMVDYANKRINWRWGPDGLDWPHHPTLLDNGNLLIFDNGPHRGYSRIIELNPATDSIVYEYKATPREAFLV